MTSWSGLTNGSTESLPASARVPSAPALRDQLLTPQTSGTDPLDALNHILRTTGSAQATAFEDSQSQLSNDEFIDDIDFKGLSLQSFVASEPVEASQQDRKEVVFSEGELSSLVINITLEQGCNVISTPHTGNNPKFKNSYSRY